MVKYTILLDKVFQALSDPTRRDILERVAHCEMQAGELAAKYDTSFAAISKHLKVLENAGLVCRRKDGRRHFVSLEPEALGQADRYLERYRRMWESRYDKLEKLLKDKKK